MLVGNLTSDGGTLEIHESLLRFTGDGGGERSLSPLGNDTYFPLIIVSISFSVEQCLLVIMRPHVQIRSLSEEI